MKYTSEDLTTLASGRAYREKLGMYLSADRQEAINLGLRELIVNAQDEYEVYKPKSAFIKIWLDSKQRIITIQDNLRGIPVGDRQDGENSLVAAFLIPHSGAKHKEGAYSSSVGINGQGNKIVCHTAEWLKVRIRRDGKEYNLSFKSNDEGAYIDAPLTESTLDNKMETGTYIQYKPDKKVYGDVFIDFDVLRKTLREMSLFTKGLSISLYIDDSPVETFFSQNGLIDGLISNKGISKPFAYHYETDDCKVELALQWVTERGNIKGYANGLYMPDGGAFITGFRTSLTRRFNDLSKGKFDGEKIRSLLDGYVSVKVKVGQFTNQQKTALANPEAREATSKAISECLNQFYNKHRHDFDRVVELLAKVEKAEVAAEKARNAILNATKEIASNKNKKVFASDKLKDAIKLGVNSTLILTEGKSAASTITVSRDPETFGILQLRGKIISALTNPMEKILENEEVKLIISALGLSLKNFKEKDLRYGKIAVAADADADGSNITNLIITLFYVLFPEVLKEGRLYRFFSPLYRVKKGKEIYYYYSEEEKLAGVVGGEVERFKGLGSLSAEDAKNIFFNPKWQRLERLEWDDSCSKLIENLLGEDVGPRKEFVFNNIDFEQYGAV